jgi:hypothetical protein
VRQATVLELAPDEKTERFLVHSGLAGSSGREHTPNSPGSRRLGSANPGIPRCSPNFRPSLQPSGSTHCYHRPWVRGGGSVAEVVEHVADFIGRLSAGLCTSSGA